MPKSVMHVLQFLSCHLPAIQGKTMFLVPLFKVTDSGLNLKIQEHTCLQLKYTVDNRLGDGRI